VDAAGGLTRHRPSNEFDRTKSRPDDRLETMVEYLALPGWQTTPVDVQAWVAQLTELGGPTSLARESPTVNWVEVPGLRLRGYAVIEDGKVTAINFELHAPDPDPALRALEAAASALGWELHPDDPDDPDDDED